MEQLKPFLQRLEDTFNTGDPEIRTWFLVQQNYLLLILCGAYVIFSKVLGPAIMRNKKPFDLRKIMIIFNFCIVVTYVISLSTILMNLPKVTRQEFCKGAVVKRGDPSYVSARAYWVIYILKYIEFLDTVFFILRRKENLITFLHVLHHTIVPIFGWIMLRTEKSGFQCIPVLVNTFVHIVLYSYYGLAAMGPEVRKYLLWKKYITQLQMMQFVFIIMFVTILASLTDCMIVQTSYEMDIFMASVFLYLFYRYYKTNFQPSIKQRVESTEDSNILKTAEEKALNNECEKILSNDNVEAKNILSTKGNSKKKE